MPDVSIVVPTHNRAAMLTAHLRALSAQTYPRHSTEWIVVCDGCTDGSALVARECGADRVIEQPASGPAAARNAGMAVATGALVCFLDDDIIPDPGWVAAFVADLRKGEARILHMGYCPHAPSSIKTHLDRRNANWYQTRIDAIQKPGYEPRFTDFFCGNFAVNQAEFSAFGGFDPSFWLAEDYELAFRALGVGWRIRFVPDARAEHHFHRGPRAYGQQAFRVGQADAVLVRFHPEIAPEVRIGLPRRPLKRVAGLAWRAVALRTAISVNLVERLALIGERARMRPLLNLLYALLWDGQYWRGVAAG
jgi:GT2 family glycosyltransferase